MNIYIYIYLYNYILASAKIWIYIYNYMWLYKDKRSYRKRIYTVQKEEKQRAAPLGRMPLNLPQVLYVSAKKHM